MNAMGSDDSGDGNRGRVSGVIRLFQDFQDDPFSQFHASGSE